MRHEVKSEKTSPIMPAVLTFLFGTLLVTFVYAADITDVITDPIQTCEDTCLQNELDQSNSTQRTALETCNMLCGNLPIWPEPSYLEVTNNSISTFSKNRILVELIVPNEIRNDLRSASNIFVENLAPSKDFWVDDGNIEYFIITINVDHNENVLKITTNESYHLTIKKLEKNVEVNISSPTYFGARHALETLSQLIWLDVDKQMLSIIHDIEITDTPKFAHRGLMVDTARNYFNVDQLKRVIDGMAATKLNVLHLHLTDASSFPIVLPRNELFAKYGAYDPDMVYTPEDIKGLVEYARINGIRVILEIDAPSHMSDNLNKATKDLVICGEDSLFNGHLNHKNADSLKVLEDIYRDLLDLGTDNEMFHIGGDEVNLTCWGSMSDWIDFTNKMFDTAISANEEISPQYMVIWSSDLTDNYIKKFNYKNIVVQYWFGSISSILANGNKVILSTVGHWYLDCGFGSWRTNKDSGVCDPFTTWHTFYKYRPWVEEFPNNREQILGGEACLWSELVEADSLETRIWPRAAALAERLWSDPPTFDRKDVYKRLDTHRERLKTRGIKSEGIWPRWCSQHPDKC